MKSIPRGLMAVGAVAVLTLGSAGCDLQSTVWNASIGASGLSSDKLAGPGYKFRLLMPAENQAHVEEAVPWEPGSGLEELVESGVSPADGAYDLSGI